MRTFTSAYASAIENYCPQVGAFRAESGLTAAQASEYIRSVLADWPKEPSEDGRRKLAAAFLAAGEPYSALVQWWRLEPKARREGDGLGPDSVQELERRARSMNENGQIGARLAVRLNLERVYSADDHSADLVLAEHGDALWERMAEIWATGDATRIQKYDAARAAIAKGCVIEALRFYNAPGTQSLMIDNDFRLAMNDDEGKQFGRIYNAWYQTRNLRMASNIVAAGADQPGSKILSVVGASHKAYFEALLDTMHDIELVDTRTVLQHDGSAAGLNSGCEPT